MADFPRSLPEFQRRFPDAAACAAYLAEAQSGLDSNPRYAKAYKQIALSLLERPKGASIYRNAADDCPDDRDLDQTISVANADQGRDL